MTSNFVIQDDLQAVLPPVNGSPLNVDSPLLLVQVTVCKTETCVGVAWHHTLGIVYPW